MSVSAAWKWIAALVVSLWGGLSVSVQLLLIMMAFDFATGLASGFVEHKIDSAISFRGLVKKTMTLIMVAVCHLISAPIHLTFDLGEVVALAYAVNEVISIVENCARVGVPIPPIVLVSLAKFKALKPQANAAPPTRAGQVQEEK